MGTPAKPENVEAAADEEYDPHLYRNVPKPTTNIQTLAHILKACIGTGILAMPEGFKNAGLWLAIGSTIFIGWLCCYCLHLLVKSQYVLCKKLKVPLLRYPESMEAAFANGPDCLKKASRFAYHFTNIILIIYQVGLACVYYVFIAVSLKYIIDNYVEDPINVKMVMVYMFLPFCAILTIKNLKMLAPFSIVATLITFATVGVVCSYILRDLPPFEDIPNEATPMSYAIYFGTVIFAVQSIGVVTSAEQNMLTPKAFLKPFGVLNISAVIITSIYIFVGLFGYWRYCLHKVEPSITLNLPRKETLAIVIVSLYTLAIYISTGLQGYVAVYLTWNGCVEKKAEEWSDKKKIIVEYVMRMCVGIISFGAAVSIPFLGLIISLVGSFGLSLLGFIFPAILEICAFWPDRLGPKKIVMWKDILIIIFGFIGLSCGSFACIHGIIEESSKGEYI